MADGKVKIETSVDQKGIETGLQEAEKKIQDFGKAAQTEAQQVDKSLSSMGQNVGSDLQTGMDHAQDVMEQGADQITDAVADVDQSLEGMGDGVSQSPLAEDMQVYLSLLMQVLKRLWIRFKMLKRQLIR